MREHKQQPFAPFGHALKKLREKTSKSQAEVSGAVEIDLNKLASYEIGESRPSEDILYLLIQHFDLKDIEAKELWRLAGYDSTDFNDSQFFSNDDIGGAKQVQSIPMSQHDARIVYTDMIQVMVNNYGVILNFMQGAGVKNNPLAVARVGMSKEHAASVIEVLKTTLEQANNIDSSHKTPKQLSSGNNNQDQ